jgi:hypothetical protein
MPPSRGRGRSNRLDTALLTAHVEGHGRHGSTVSTARGARQSFDGGGALAALLLLPPDSAVSTIAPSDRESTRGRGWGANERRPAVRVENLGGGLTWVRA